MFKDNVVDVDIMEGRKEVIHGHKYCYKLYYSNNIKPERREAKPRKKCGLESFSSSVDIKLKSRCILVLYIIEVVVALVIVVFSF